MENVVIFIDGANLLHGLSDDFDRINLDFELVVQKLVGERRLARVYYYTALPDQNRDKERYQKSQNF